MLSKKLTFFLPSLLILLTAVLCLPVGAQDAYITGFGKGEFLVIGKSGGIVPGSTLFANWDDMPDLEKFFSLGGTVELIITTADGDGAIAGSQLDDAIGALAGATNHRKPEWQDLVISEIMWGLDGGSTNKQWIEIYNTTGLDMTIHLGESPPAASVVNTAGEVTNAGSVHVSFKFTSHAPAMTESEDNIVVSDRVSNVGTGGKWTMPGSSGVTTSPIGNTNAPPQSNIVSAYRNINYAAV
ncbi:MAG: hypothetical protein OXU36_24440, partial [Candidatus Poribacteria bacterium]|nr:hypothetical protein [Candidatus Poribacteria bacterium]